MKKRKWLLVILAIIIVATCYYLFYKTYSKQRIPKSADIVLSIDVKKNRNTIIAYFITTPSEWTHAGSLFKAKDTTVFDWKNVLEMPDYIFIFHVKNQSATIYNCVLKIKDEEEFKKGLIAYHFIRTATNNSLETYYSDSLNIVISKKENQLLISNASSKEIAYINATADELFTHQRYMDEATIKNIASPSNHFSIYLQKNSFLAKDAILNGNFNNGKLTIDGLLQPLSSYLFKENNFSIADSSLLTLGFTQPFPAVYALINNESKIKASTTLNFSIDSLFIPQNNSYQLDIPSIKSKTDSAISYTYDDDFNKVEKVVVNKIQEPEFNFTVSRNSYSNLFQYWIENKNIEQTDSGAVFVAIPFVKTYVRDKKDSLLLTSYNYSKSTITQHLNCIAFLNINFNKAPDNLFNYFPDAYKQLFLKLSSLNFIATKSGQAIKVNFTVNSKENNKPFLLCF